MCVPVADPESAKDRSVARVDIGGQIIIGGSEQFTC